MTILTTDEGMQWTAFLLREYRIMSDYPLGEEQKKSFEAHCKEQDKLKEIDKNYVAKRWYRPGNEPIRRTQEEQEERNRSFIEQLLSKRNEDFDLMKAVDSFDPITNFKKDMEKICGKINE